MITRLALTTVLALLMLSAFVRPAGAWTDADVSAALTQASNATGVSRWVLRQVSHCESRWNPYARGDWRASLGRYTSHGLFQINDLSTGLMWHFRSVGYRDPYNPYEAAAYFARVLKGEFRSVGVTVYRWSCWNIAVGW